MKVAIMGYGQYGRAIGTLLKYNRVAFTPVDVDMPLTHAVDVLIQGVPTQFIRSAFRTNAKFFSPDMIVVNTAKGIEKSSHELPYQIIEELGYGHNYYSLMGPSFASGIKDKDPTLVSLGFTSEEHTKTIKKLLQTPYFRIQQTEDYRAIELAAAMKNVYAILCGYADGMGLGANTFAKLVTLSLQEIVRLSEAMEFSIDFLAPGIVGDLVLTCSSPESRNYRFGKSLALSESSKEALSRIGNQTVEGFHTSVSVLALSERFKVDLPVAQLTQGLIDKAGQGRALFHEFVETIT